MVHLFTSAVIQKKRWAPRISLSLDIPEKQDKLEKAVKDLVAFKAIARCYLDRVTGFKRTKETSSDVRVSPDTISDCPGSKVAKRLAQAVLPWELCSPSLVFSRHTRPLLRKQTLELDPLDIVHIHKPQVLDLGLYGINITIIIT